MNSFTLPPPGAALGGDVTRADLGCGAVGMLLAAVNMKYTSKLKN